MSVFVGLKEKGLPFTIQTVDLDAGANRADDYAVASLTQRVPMLVDGDFRLSEWSAITEYLEDAYPGVALYPASVRDKARARQIQAWLRSDLLPIRHERSTIGVFYRLSDAPLSATAEQAVQKLFKAADALLAHCGSGVDAQSADRKWRCGDGAACDYATRHWSRASMQEWAALTRRPL